MASFPDIANKNLKFVAPNAEDLEKGAEYLLRIGPFLYGEGDITARSSGERWRTEKRKRQFAVIDAAGNTILQIRRDKLFPPLFSLIADDEVIGTMASRPVMRNRYVVTFATGETWAFHPKLFTAYFPGESADGKKLWVTVGPSKREWSLLIQPGADDPRLVAALAFMHREWWFHG